MANSKKLLVIILIMVIIIIIITTILLIYINRGKIFYGVDVVEDDTPYIANEKVIRVNSRNDFATVKTCIDKFYIYYTGMFSNGNDIYIIDEEAEASIKEKQKESENALYNILSEEYIQEKQITLENIKSKFKELNEVVIDINDMYVSEKSQNLAIYMAEGAMREKKSGKISNFKIILKLDKLNRTFAVLPQDYVEQNYSNIAIGENININMPKSIEENKNNIYSFVNVTEEDYVNDLINKLTEELLYNPKLVYEYLDEEYKKNKATDVVEFTNYINKNIKRFVTTKIEKYQKTEQDDYIQYVCKDTEGRYYIFKETAPMKYTVILDTYTIEIPEFTKKYNESDPRAKVILNINKFMQSINDKDYKYAYNILADSFKQENFKTLAEFENYIKTNWFENNEFEYEKFGDEANTYYTYQVKITDKSEKDDKKITKTFIVLLEDGIDFKLSFNK